MKISNKIKELKKELDEKNLKNATAAYAAIVEEVAKEYTDGTNAEFIRQEYPEINFMDEEKIEKLLEHAKNERRRIKMKKNIKVINCTPHDVNLITTNGNITFPRSGIIPRLKEVQQKINSVNSNGIEIDIMEKSFLEPEGLPEPKEGTIYIVSALVAGAAKDRDDLVVPNDTIRDGEGNIIGCKNLARI